MDEVYLFLKQNLDVSQKQYLVVGVSGGADSMTLLTILDDYCKDTNCQLVCAHVHHNLRKESDKEQLFVQNFCKEHQIIFETTKFFYEEKFTENIGRKKRYQFFEEILKKYHSSILFTAHHGDDLIETILMRLLRGSSLKGTCGISSKSKRSFYTILRPLLFINKEDIYQYVRNKQIPYVEDSSNLDYHYTRNRYRHEIIPFLKKENQNLHMKFLEYSQELRESLEYIEILAREKYDKMVLDGKLNWYMWKDLDVVLQKEVLRQYLFTIYQEDIDKITRHHLEIFMNFIKNGMVNTHLDFPDGYEVIKDYQVIYLKKKVLPYDYTYQLIDKIELPDGHIIETLSSSEDTSNFVTYLDSSMFTLPLIVRNYHVGDKMSIKNMDGHKKVGDIFTNEKVPLEDRKIWPVVTDSKDVIIWLPGLKKTQFHRKKDEFYDIILKYY